MFKFELKIYWSDEDHAFIAEVPQLPGCAADGKTYKEAVENVEGIIQEWIETAKELGRPIPKTQRKTKIRLVIILFERILRSATPFRRSLNI